MKPPQDALDRGRLVVLHELAINAGSDKIGLLVRLQKYSALIAECPTVNNHHASNRCPRKDEVSYCLLAFFRHRTTIPHCTVIRDRRVQCSLSKPAPMAADALLPPALSSTNRERSMQDGRQRAENACDTQPKSAARACKIRPPSRVLHTQSRTSCRSFRPLRGRRHTRQ